MNCTLKRCLAYVLLSKNLIYDNVDQMLRLNYSCYLHRRRQRGHREGPPPPEMEKNCCRKMKLFPKALFLATTFQKIVKNSIFLLNFHQKFTKFSQNFPTNCLFRPNARKINSLFVKLFEKYSKIMHFLQFT